MTKEQLKTMLEQNGTAGAALLLEVFNYFDEALSTTVATTVATTVGKLSDLQTTDKTNIVAAINEVASAS